MYCLFSDSFPVFGHTTEQCDDEQTFWTCVDLSHWYFLLLSLFKSSDSQFAMYHSQFAMYQLAVSTMSWYMWYIWNMPFVLNYVISYCEVGYQAAVCFQKIMATTPKGFGCNVAKSICSSDQYYCILSLKNCVLISINKPTWQFLCLYVWCYDMYVVI